MEYKSWTFRNGGLFVERYKGVVSKEEIIKNDVALLSGTESQSQPLMVLSDVSNATFPNLKYEQIGDLYAFQDTPLGKTKEIKIAIFTGSILFEDFQKMLTYSKTGQSRHISVVPFNFLSSATRWLRLTPQEEKEISNFFSEF